MWNFFHSAKPHQCPRSQHLSKLWECECRFVGWQHASHAPLATHLVVEFYTSYSRCQLTCYTLHFDLAQTLFAFTAAAHGAQHANWPESVAKRSAWGECAWRARWVASASQAFGQSSCWYQLSAWIYLTRLWLFRAVFKHSQISGAIWLCECLEQWILWYDDTWEWAYKELNYSYATRDRHNLMAWQWGGCGHLIRALLL